MTDDWTFTEKFAYRVRHRWWERKQARELLELRRNIDYMTEVLMALKRGREVRDGLQPATVRALQEIVERSQPELMHNQGVIDQNSLATDSVTRSR